MTTEKRYIETLKRDTNDAICTDGAFKNIVNLGSDYRDIFEHSRVSDITYINHEKLVIIDDSDPTCITYTTHEDSPRNTLIFNLYDRYLENKLVKELEFITVLDVSSKDAKNEVSIKNLGISLVENEGEIELITRSKETEEVGSREMSVRIPLDKKDDEGNYYFKASDSEDEDLWPVIKETFAEGFLYHLEDLVISYDTRDRNLTLAMELE
jgi:hypothetical protein